MALLKLTPFLQEWCVTTFPDDCHPEPGRWGQSGWTRLRWAAMPQDQLPEMVKASWLAVAPAELRHRADE